jgi:Secretion system C-terminal sorting domain
MKRAIFIVQLLALGVISFSQNLVVNPGFESWETTTKPTGWTTAQGCLQESVNFKSGSYSNRQEGTSSSKDIGQKIAVNEAKKYRFSFSYKTGSTTTGNGCRIWCEWLDDKQVSINDPSSISVLHSGFLKSDSWQQFSTDLNPPASAAYFNLLVRSLPNSITYWDDFEFSENVATGYAEEKLSNLLIYPNPAYDFLHISNIDELKHIDIQSLTGSTVWSSDFDMEKSVTLPISGLKDGLYIINFRTSNKLICKKFIKRQL